MPNPFPAYRSLNPRGVSSFHHGPRSPSERLTSPEPPTSQPASTSLGSVTLRRHHPIEPHVEQAVPGPPRFRSQAFSASQRFPGKIELRGLVSCRCRPGFPFRAYPSQESCSPLDVTSSPAVVHQRAESHLPGLSLAVSPTTTPKRSSLDPRPAMSPLFTGAQAHQRPGFPEPRQTEPTLFRQLRLLRSLTPPASPFRADRVIHRAGRRNSPGLRPSRAPPVTAWALEPAQASRPEHVSPPRRGVTRDVGDLAAPVSGGTSSLANERLDPLDGFQPPSRLARTTSRRRPDSLDLGAPSRSSSPVAFEVSKSVISDESRETRPLS
jgi:hypothetical protein